MASVRRNSGQTQGGFCPLCGGGRSKGGGLWKWVIGAVVIWFLIQNNSGEGAGSSDYKPPAQTQTDERKCDPGALIDFGCTP